MTTTDLHSSDYNDFIHSGNDWETPANPSGCEDGIFLIRVTASISSKKKQAEVPDSTVILGYNIYRADTAADSQFVKINTAPVTDTSYTDVLDCMASYYITTVFTTCESDPSAILTTGCGLVGMNELKKADDLVIDPNPANGYVDISSVRPITALRLTDLFGQLQFSMNNIWDTKVRIDLSDFKNGMYLLMIDNQQGSSVRKIILNH